MLVCWEDNIADFITWKRFLAECYYYLTCYGTNKLYNINELDFPTVDNNY